MRFWRREETTPKRIISREKIQVIKVIVMISYKNDIIVWVNDPSFLFVKVNFIINITQLANRKEVVLRTFYIIHVLELNWLALDTTISFCLSFPIVYIGEYSPIFLKIILKERLESCHMLKASTIKIPNMLLALNHSKTVRIIF